MDTSEELTSEELELRAMFPMSFGSSKRPWKEKKQIVPEDPHASRKRDKILFESIVCY